jgi:hypothetical protein
MKTPEQIRAEATERQRKSRERRKLASVTQPVTPSQTVTDAEPLTVAAVVVPPAAPLIPTPAHAPEEELKFPTPARLPNGQFPKRHPLCPPATADQFKHALAMMQTGATMSAIRKTTGADWQALNERGLADHPHDWCAIAQAWRENRALALIDRAQEVALGESPAEVTEATGPMGTTTTQRRKTDPAMIGQALAGLMPGVHGKAAGRAPTQINVGGNAHIFGGPPPAGSLDDYG